MELLARYGPLADTIQFVIANHVSLLTAERAGMVMMMTDLVATQNDAQHAALRAARVIPGREAMTMRASEDMRQAVWGVIWESTQADAWRVAWAAAMCGTGLATIDLVGTEGYTLQHYTDLVGPWMTGGFSDLPIRKES